MGFLLYYFLFAEFLWCVCSPSLLPFNHPPIAPCDDVASGELCEDTSFILWVVLPYEMLFVQYAVSHCFSDGRSRERTNYRLISPSRMIGAKIVWRKAQAVELRAQIISDGDEILHHKILYSWEWTTKPYCRTKSLIWKAWAILNMFVSRRYKVVKLLLELDLLWESCWNNPNYLPRRSLEWRAPTWSWASVKGTIRYPLLDVTPEYKDYKPTSGITSPSDDSSARWRSALLGHSRINMA